LSSKVTSFLVGSKATFDACLETLPIDFFTGVLTNFFSAFLVGVLTFGLELVLETVLETGLETGLGTGLSLDLRVLDFFALPLLFTGFGLDLGVDDFLSVFDLDLPMDLDSFFDEDISGFSSTLIGLSRLVTFCLVILAAFLAISGYKYFNKSHQKF
jgi:hypothetical protein